MSRINVLSKEISELIAAGEVIERPCSVVKELIENSIDAGANIITVEIKNGGISYMRITDNGCGISPDDVPVAFLRHATSKISNISQLDNITSLGFRGEALASVCAVSKVELMSKRPCDELGCRYCIAGATETAFENIGCPEGTTIVIRDLFYNVPARLKFLKKAVTEGNAIASVVNKLALSHPEISFKFIRDNSQDLLTPGDGKLYSAIYNIFGKNFATTLIPVDYEINGIKITGYTAKPLLARSNRAFQHFFINNRYIKSVTCTVSLEEAYRNSIMTGKFPACVLDIKIPPQIVDVNVHPAKIEVRFSDEKMIFDSIYFAIKNALLEDNSLKEIKVAEQVHFSKQAVQNEVIEPQPVQYKMDTQPLQLSSNQVEYKTENTTPAEITPKIVSENIEKNNYVSVSPVEDELKDFKFLNTQSFKAPKIKEDIIDIAKENEDIKVTFIGEAFNTYIIAQIDDDLLLIDKHAAHERYIFEKLKTEKNLISTQLLLTPYSVLLSHAEYDALMNNIDTLLEFGFAIEEDECPKINVMGVPSIIKNDDIDDLIAELAENFMLSKNQPNLKLVDELFHSIACRSAIKANDISSKNELIEIIKLIYQNENMKYCPHGRPIMIKMTKREIEKQFKRIL